MKIATALLVAGAVVASAQPFGQPQPLRVQVPEPNPQPQPRGQQVIPQQWPQQQWQQPRQFGWNTPAVQTPWTGGWNNGWQNQWNPTTGRVLNGNTVGASTILNQNWNYQPTGGVARASASLGFVDRDIRWLSAPLNEPITRDTLPINTFFGNVGQFTIGPGGDLSTGTFELNDNGRSLLDGTHPQLVGESSATAYAPAVEIAMGNPYQNGVFNFLDANIQYFEPNLDVLSQWDSTTDWSNWSPGGTRYAPQPWAPQQQWRQPQQQWRQPVWPQQQQWPQQRQPIFG